MGDRPSLQAGRVSIVGAGPGDPGLVTLKAAERLAEADVVVHDELVARAVLALARPGAEIVHRRDVDDGSPEAIHRFLVQGAQRGRRVVRLQGGDPLLAPAAAARRGAPELRSPRRWPIETQ